MTTVENLKPTIWVLALDYILWSRAIIQTLSLRNSLWRRLHLINSVDNTKLPWNALPWMEHISFFRNSPSLITPLPQVTRLITQAFFMSWSIISSPTPSKETSFGKMFLVCLPSQAREWPVDCPELINLYFEPNQTKQNLIYSSITENYFWIHEWRWKRNPTYKYFTLKHR